MSKEQSRRPRLPLGERVHNWLSEADHEQFRINKWRFWFVAVAILSVINALLTWLIFRDDDENYSGAIMLSAGALVAWLVVCALHYSDSSDRKLSKWVSMVDSVALLFVGLHFAGLMYVYGHQRTLQKEDARYESRAKEYNEKAEKLSDNDLEKERLRVERSRFEANRARFENDTAFRADRIARRGGRVELRAGVKFEDAGASSAPIPLEKPVRPEISAAQFLTKHDWLIRAANYGELFLAFLTMILIRNFSANSNKSTAPAPRLRDDYTDAVSGPAYPRRTRPGFVTAEDRPPGDRPKAPRNWI